MAAYQSLGQFISTFAEPAVAGFRITENGLRPCAKVIKPTDSPINMKESPNRGQTQAESTEAEGESSNNQRYRRNSLKNFEYG